MYFLYFRVRWWFSYLRTQLFFADLNFRKYNIFILSNICLKCSHSWQLSAFGTVLSYMALLFLKYSYVGKENIRYRSMRIWIRNIAFLISMQIWGFAICGLAHLRFSYETANQCYVIHVINNYKRVLLLGLLEYLSQLPPNVLACSLEELREKICHTTTCI
jgi:hypothetical protein